jgi:hypothetical protein
LFDFKSIVDIDSLGLDPGGADHFHLLGFAVMESGGVLTADPFRDVHVDLLSAAITAVRRLPVSRVASERRNCATKSNPRSDSSELLAVTGLTPIESPCLVKRPVGGNASDTESVCASNLVERR